MRNITNINDILSSRSIDNGGDLNQLTADLPLNLVLDETTNDSINLGGLSSYGGAGKIIKINSNNDGLEYANETDTVHTAQTPLVIINNVIGLNGISGYGNSIGGRQLIRTNATSTGLEYFDQPDFITSVTLPLAISISGAISLSGLSNFGGAGKIIKVNSSNNGFEYANEQDISDFVTASSTTTFTNKSMSYNQLTTPPISNDGLSNTKLIQFRNSGSPARAIEFSNSAGAYRHTVEHTNNGLQFYAGNSSTGINLTQIINISTTGLKIQRINMIENTDSFNVLMFNSATGLIAKSRSTYIMPSTTGTLALTSDIPDTSGFVTASSTTTFTNKSMSYNQLTTPPISNDGLSNTKLIQFRNSGSPARAIEFSNSAGAYRHTVEHTNNGLQFYAGNSSTGINLTQIINISTTGLKIQRINMIENTDSFNVLMFNSATGLIAKSRSTYIMPSTTGTLALTSDIPDTSGFVTASSTTTFTNKSMSYGQVTSRPFEVNYSAGLLFANYLSIFKTVSNRCILFTNSSSNYRHGIKHNDTNLEFYLSTTNDGFTGLNKKLTIGLTSIQPTVDISLLAIGNSTGVSQIIKFNNDNFNTIGANFNTEVGNGGGLEIKGYAIIENIITREDTTKNMRSILSHNGFHILKGTNLTTDKTLLLLRDGGTNYLGNVGNNLIIDGYDISIGSASGLMKLRSATLEYYYYNTTNMIFTAKIYDNKYELQAPYIRCASELNMRDNSTLGKINMADGPIFWRNRYKSGDNTYVTDFNHYTQYSSSPVDGIRHQGWNGVSLGYTNGGPGTALFTSGSGVYFGNGTPVSSDDRIKFNETKITYNALETINKLVVVEYDKKYNKDLPESQYGEEMENHLLNDTPQKEYGYIAQDTWNNIPELRFTIKGVDTTIPENFDEDGKLIEDCKIRTTNPEGEEFIDRKYLSIDYANINVLNVRAVQELYEIVKQQQIIIDKLVNSTSYKHFKSSI